MIVVTPRVADLQPMRAESPEVADLRDSFSSLSDRDLIVGRAAPAFAVIDRQSVDLGDLETCVADFVDGVLKMDR